MARKARSLNEKPYTTERYVLGSPSTGHGIAIPGISAAQVTHSWGHPYRLLGKDGRNIGGPFFSIKLENGDLPDPVSSYSGWYNNAPRQKTVQRVYPSPAARTAARVGNGSTDPGTLEAALTEAAPYEKFSDNDLDSRGATAISRANPINPVFEGAATIAELISERKFFSVPGRSGNVSGEYLNYQFGVAPAVGGAQDLLSAIKRSEEIVDQLERDSGRKVRRQYRFPSERTVDQSKVWTYPTCDVTSNANEFKPGWLTTTTTRETEIWFSGAFTYCLPAAGLNRRLSELDRLYGIKPGMDTGWELIPFSWMVDYFSNAGDVVKNLNAFAQDGLVMSYGYIMAKTTVYVSERWDGQICKSTWRPFSAASNRVYTIMQRRSANPFGFGILDEDLSPRQWSILAAVGISRR